MKTKKTTWLQIRVTEKEKEEIKEIAKKKTSGNISKLVLLAISKL